MQIRVVVRIRQLRNFMVNHTLIKVSNVGTLWDNVSAIRCQKKKNVRSNRYVSNLNWRLKWLTHFMLYW